MPRQTKDLTNKKFKHLIAIKFERYDKRGAIWSCLCECQKIIEVPASALTCGLKTSCGCYYGNYKTWNKDEKQFLIDNYSIKGKKFCAKHLNKTLSQVANKVIRMKLKRNSNAKYGRPLDLPDDSYYCSTCEKVKLKVEFIKSKKIKQCKLCHRKQSRQYYKNNAEKCKRQSKEKILKNPEARIYIATKARAKKYNIPFNLEKIDIIIPTHCPVLGIPLVLFSNEGNTPSVDRFIPELGYIKGNIHIISDRANTLKNNGKLEEIEKIYFWMKSVANSSSGSEIPSS